MVVGASTTAILRQRVATLTAEGADRIIAIGGDGTVHQVLQGVAGTRTVLGVVPVGTGNDFAAALGLSTDPVVAARAALDAPLALDAMRAGDTWVASVATAGFSAVVNARANRLRWPHGPARYTVATMLALPRLAPLQVRVTLDGADAVELETVLLSVANTARFGGGMKIAPAADPIDGLLDLTVIGAIGRVTLLRAFSTIFAGTHIHRPEVSTFRARRIEVTGTDEPPGVWGDGEPIGLFPLTFEAVAGALLMGGVVLPSR